MSTFAVMAFGDERKAYEGLHALQVLHAEGAVTVWGSAVLQRDPEGRVSILKGDDEGPVGTGVGALTGGLVGLFGGPVAAAVGVTLGATVGGVRDLVSLGASEDFLAAVERDLAPGKLAVVAEIVEESVVPLDARMEELGAKVVREDRLAFEADLVERRVSARKARFAQLKAEHAEHRKQRAQERAGTKAEAMMEKLLTNQLDYTRRSLEYMGERYEWELVGAKQELDAKIEALLAQASGAKPEVRARIEQRMAEVRDEFAERQRKLERARELTRQALQP